MSDTQPGMPDSSLGELFSHLTSDLSALIRDEVQLAKIELKEEVAAQHAPADSSVARRSPATWSL